MRARRPRRPATDRAGTPLPPRVRERIQLSADLLAALLDVEGRDRPTLDDLEWADALAVRLTARRSAREAAQEACASTATTPRRSPSIARRAVFRSGSSATSAT